MKTLVCSLMALSGFNLFAQNTGSSPPPAQQPSDTPFAVATRSSSSRVWQRTVYEQSPTGQLVPRVHSYTELASGACYQQNGQWVDSVEAFTPLDDGSFEAVQG